MADARPVALADLQRRFYDQVTAGAPADGLTATGELDVYAQMYAIRLLDALVEDYPKLHAKLGDQAFRARATTYLRAHPPRSFTLRELGAGFAAHLRADPHAPAWAADLAALERARMDVFDGPDATPLAQADVVALGDQLPELALAWVPSSVVVPIAWAVDDLWSAIEDASDADAGDRHDHAHDHDHDHDHAHDHDHEETSAPAYPDPEPCERVVLVWRRELSVLHRTLEADEAMASAPIAAGARFAEICEVLGTLHGEEDAGARAVQLLLRWLENSTLVAAANPLP